ncbi:MAG: hypothetical protein ACFFC7_10880, partial [Candidatus Hermodarchaeota archaeon]
VRSTPFFRHCRGMIINSEGKIVNLPFLRFLEFDYADESKKINWQNAIAEEKHDGSLINVFYTNQKWYIATRRRIEAVKELKDKFLELFGNHFDHLSKEHCYSFELVSSINRITQLYEQDYLYLLLVRNLDTLQEQKHEFKEKLAAKIPTLQLPKQYSVTSLKETRQLFTSLDKQPHEEGFVVVDDKYQRLKVKSEDYYFYNKIVVFKRSLEMIESIVKDDLVPLSYLEAFPEAHSKYMGLKNKYLTFLDQLVQTYSSFYWEQQKVGESLNKQRKRLEQQIKKKKELNLLLELLYEDIKPAKAMKFLKEYIRRKINYQTILQLIGY